MRALLLIFLFALSSYSFSQVLDPDRYRETIFASSLETENIQYGTAPQWIWPNLDVDLFLDVFQPNGDLNPERPLIIFAHQGGFLYGNKDYDDITALCDSFARMGYVTATIDYRKGYDPLESDGAERAAYRAIQDGNAAVRYFKEYASIYDIDTNNIFFGGMSAGAFIALHVAYLDKEAERPASTYDMGLFKPDLGCLDCSGNSYTHTSQVKAVVDCWGGVLDSAVIEVGDVPVIIYHGTADAVVPYTSGNIFGVPTMPVAYGASAIVNQCEAIGVPYEATIVENGEHQLNGTSNGAWSGAPNSFWTDTLLPQTTDFLFELIRPFPSKISPDTVYLGLNEIYTHQLVDDANSQYLWTFDSGNIDELTNTNSSEIELKYVTPGNYDLEVIEFNHLLAASDTLKFHVVVDDDLGVDSESEFNLDIYPNPCHGELYIASNVPIDELVIFNVDGKVIYSITEAVENEMLDLSGFDSGIYFLKVRAESQLITKKIIKK